MVSPRPRITHHYNAHVCTPPTSWCLLVFGFLGSRCNSLLSHDLFLSFLFFSRLVLSSILGDYTRVWVFPCPFFRLVLSFHFRSQFSMSRREAVEERNPVYMYPVSFSPPVFPPSRFLVSSPFFICDNSSYPAQPSRWYPYLCTPFAKGPSCPFPFPLGRI